MGTNSVDQIRVTFSSAGAVRRRPSPHPFVVQVGSGFVPFIHHPDRETAHLRVESFRRKAKATAGEALHYAQCVIWYRQMRAAEKRRRLEATRHPRFLRYFSEAAE